MESPPKTDLGYAVLLRLKIYSLGDMLEAAIANLSDKSKVILCGAISQYNTPHPFKGPANFAQIIRRNVQFLHYIVTDYDYLYPEFFNKVMQLYVDGNLYYKETIIDGIENSWGVLIQLFKGVYAGKVIISI